MKIYVASSWRNERQPEVVARLRDAGHEVYDFKNPEPGNHGFHWSEIDPNWKNWDMKTYKDCLYHPIAEKGFNRDFQAMQWADACVCVHPCGRSAHLELGWFAGADKYTFLLLADGEPELMTKMCDFICTSIDEVISKLKTLQS
jgi:hypothetical protein